jgi:hypothetical protein
MREVGDKKEMWKKARNVYKREMLSSDSWIEDKRWREKKEKGGRYTLLKK